MLSEGISRSHHTLQCELVVPAQQRPCYFRLLSQKQHMQQLLLQQLSQLLTQHFCTTPLVTTPTRPKVSVATQIECKMVVLQHISNLRKKITSPFKWNGYPHSYGTADEGGLQEARAPIQTALSHPPALAGKGKAEGFSVTWLLSLKRAGFCLIAVEYIPQILFFCAL